jgi:hypothetical protein
LRENEKCRTFVSGRRDGQSRADRKDGDHYQNGAPAAAFLAGKPGPDL